LHQRAPHLVTKQLNFSLPQQGCVPWEDHLEDIS
jgi:hypothetical protein